MTEETLRDLAATVRKLTEENDALRARVDRLDRQTAASKDTQLLGILGLQDYLATRVGCGSLDCGALLEMARAGQIPSILLPQASGGEAFAFNGPAVEKALLRRAERRPTRELDLLVDDLPGLSARTKNALHANRIVHLGHLVKSVAPELLRLKNFGKRGLQEVESELARLGYSLGMPVDWTQPQGGRR